MIKHLNLSPNHVRKIALAILYLLLTTGILSILFSLWAYDDPFITYRYANNLSRGLGLVYNPGERLFSTTTPLFALLLAILSPILPDLHGLAIFIILIVVQSLVAYLQLALKVGAYFNPVPFITATGVLCLLLLFYLVLALMLGTLFNSTGPVIGISIAVGIGMSILPQFLGTLAPWLIAILPGRLGDVALAIGAELPLPADWYVPLVSTGVLIVIFIAVAIARWSREEF